jgi:cation diffusion facilitator family transporter
MDERLDERRGVAATKARAAWFSIVANGLLILFKLVVGTVSGSIGIISEAVHSATDLIAAIIALVSVRQASRPADLRHRYGHEKVEDLSGVLEGLLIWGAAVLIVIEAIQHIINGEHLDHIWLAVGVMAVSAAVNLGLALYLFPVARRTESVALRADAAHHLTDVYTSAGVAGGLMLADLTGKAIFDPLLAIAVAVLIMRTAWQLVSRSTRVLLDEALPDEELAIIRDTVKEHRGSLILGYHKLRTRRAGSKRHIDLHVTVPADMPIGDAHDVAEHLETDIAGRLANTEVFVHVEPGSHEREDES